jgi:flavin-dependent dehydrogenase
MSQTDFNERYDTVVAGAGPAGVMAALHAADRGSVLLVDAARLPRDKSCGGMLNEYSQEFLSQFGAVPAESILEPRYVNFRYHDWDRGIRKPTELRFLNVDRRGFDDWLLSLLPANVTVVGATSVAGFDQDADEVRVRLTNSLADHDVRCANLVGADGPRSSVRRQLGVGSVGTYVTLQDFCPVHAEIEPYFDCIYMREVGDEFGYAYVVPKGDVAIVGSVFYPRTKRPHEKHAQVLERLQAALALGPSVKREAWVALCVRHDSDVVLGSGRVLLAGEAGGFMSPTSGEGISYALNTGRLAGQAIADGTSPNAISRYRSSVDPVTRNIARKLRWLPFMESRVGKYLAGFVPTPVVSRITRGL